MRKMSTVYLIFVYFDISVVPPLIVKFLSFRLPFPEYVLYY